LDRDEESFFVNGDAITQINQQNKYKQHKKQNNKGQHFQGPSRRIHSYRNALKHKKNNNRETIQNEK